MIKLFLDKLIESAKAVLPLTILVLVISLIIKMDSFLIINFLIGVVLLIIGLAIFSMGAENSMMLMASKIGEFLVNKKKLWLFIVVIFGMGFLIILAEPSLRVLGEQFSSVIDPMILILSVSFGTGMLLVIALLRIVFQLSLRWTAIVSYGLLFIFAGIVSIFNPDFIPVSFDSGGVSTGPLMIPFIMSLGVGMSRARGDLDSEIDSFGIVGITTVGPIFAVLFLGLFISPQAPLPNENLSILTHLVNNIKDMGIAILPFVLTFIVFQLTVFKFSKQQVIKIGTAFLYVYLGLVIFLTGANGGLVSLGFEMGKYFTELQYNYIIIPIGMLFGFVTVAAEPAVIVLNNLVEEASGGSVSKKTMLIFLSIGVSIAIGLSLLRVLTGLSIWFIILPVYTIIMLLTFVTPKMFYSIAFDSGSAVSGALTITFLMPFTIGAGYGMNDPSLSNILTDAFGLVAVISMTPILTVQILGLLTKFRKPKEEVSLLEEDHIIELGSEE